MDACNHLFFPPGVYIVRLQGGENALKLERRTGIVWDGDNATLRMADGESCAARHGNLLMLMLCSDVSLVGLTFDGNRRGRPPPFLTGSHCIDIRGCTRLVLDRVRVHDAGSDGIYVRAAVESEEATYPEDLTFRDLVVADAYRSGLSLIGGRRIRVSGGQFLRTRGAAPETGIDLEPNANDVHGLHDVMIEDVCVQENAGFGLAITGNVPVKPERIRISRISGRDNGEGLLSIGQASDVELNGLAAKNDRTNFRSRGLVFVSRSSSRVTLRDLVFEDITGASPDRALVHIHSGARECSLSDVSARRISCGVLELRASCATENVRVEEIAGEICVSLVNGTHALKGLFARAVRGHVIQAHGALFLEDLELVDCGDRVPALRILSPGSVIRRVSLRRTRPAPSGIYALYYDDIATIGILEDFNAHAKASPDYTPDTAVRLPLHRGSALVRRVVPAPHWDASIPRR